MTLDWNTALQAVGAVALLAAGAVIDRLFERRPKLLVYYSSIGAFQLTRGGQQMGVNTHTVMIRNGGSRVPLHNVRVPHAGLLEAADIHVSVFPPVPNTRELVNGGQELIVIPTLAPGQQVQLSYLYPPGILFSQINLQISSDEAMARQLPMLLAPQPPAGGSSRDGCSSGSAQLPSCTLCSSS
jgi:hypothetical protein